MNLRDQYLKLKQLTNSITSNPLLNSFEQFALERIDNEALTDPFIRTKKKNILDLIKDLKIDFNPKLKSAFDEYIEALTYLHLKTKFSTVERIPETTNKTPDFKIVFTSSTNQEETSHSAYAELKTMSYAFGNINYKEAMEQGLRSSLDVEKQIKEGKRIAFGESVIQPWFNPNKDYDPYSVKYVIEALNEKIDQNIKAGQYAMGDTVLLVDLTQMILPAGYMEGGTPFHVSARRSSIASGVQWNVAFGKQGHNILRPIEFEGKENIEGTLEKEGILWKYPFIKAICFIDQPSTEDGRPTVLGLHRNDTESDNVIAFLYQLCDFVNDDANTEGYKLFITHGDTLEI